MKVKFSWASDDTKTEIKEFNSSDEMLDFTFNNIYDRIILHKLSMNPKDITYVVDKNDKPFDLFIMVYDANVEDPKE